MPKNEDQLMTVNDLAVYLNVTTDWVYANSYRIPNTRLGRQIRFRRSAVDAWLDAGGTSAA